MRPGGLPGPQGVSASARLRPTGRPLPPRRERRRPGSVLRSVPRGVLSATGRADLRSAGFRPAE
eukprot:14822883-Alexandrium_andersonii.AAC.1